MKAKKSSVVVSNISHPTSAQMLIKAKLYSMPAQPSGSQKRTETTNAITLQPARNVHLINTVRNGHLRKAEKSGSCTLLIFCVHAALPDGTNRKFVTFLAKPSPNPRCAGCLEVNVFWYVSKLSKIHNQQFVFKRTSN